MASFTESKVAHSVLYAMALQRDEFAERLKELRERNGETQQMAADRIGISLRAYSRLATGQASARASTIDDICEVYKVDRDFLLGPPKAPLGLSDASERFESIGDQLRAIRRMIDEHTELVRRVESKLDRNTAIAELVLERLGLNAIQAVTETTDGLDLTEDRPKRAGGSRKPVRKPAKRAS